MADEQGITRGLWSGRRLATAEAAAPIGYRGLGVLAAGLAGFVSGIVFWHLVGFWSLVNEAVYHHNPEDGAAPVPARIVAAKSQGRHVGVPGPMSSANEACLEAVPGEDGLVRSGSCEGLALKLAPQRGIGRADFADFGATPATTLINGAESAPASGAPAVGGWIAEVAPAAKP